MTPKPRDTKGRFLSQAQIRIYTLEDEVRFLTNEAKGLVQLSEHRKLINRDLSTRNDNQAIQIRRLKADAEMQMEAIAGLERKVRHRTIIWFTIGLFTASVGLLATYYLIRS